MNYNYEDLENAFGAGLNCPIAGATFEEYLECHKLENKIPFHPMWKKPNASDDDERISVMVLVYEVDPVTNIMTDKDLGYYDFESDNWSVLGGFEMELVCWSYIPDPCEFIKNKDWERIIV